MKGIYQNKNLLNVGPTEYRSSKQNQIPNENSLTYTIHEMKSWDFNVLFINTAASRIFEFLLVQISPLPHKLHEILIIKRSHFSKGGLQAIKM